MCSDQRRTEHITSDIFLMSFIATRGTIVHTMLLYLQILFWADKSC